MAVEHVLHMQKALDQMNLQIHRVLNDITGLSGLRILDAILAGERDPVTLARLCHSRVKSSEDTVAKSLEGDYRPEHLFALKQSLAAFRYYQSLISEADQEIQRQLNDLDTAVDAEDAPPKRTKASPYQRRRYEPKNFDLRGELYRIFGVDLTNVPGVSAITAQTILCEIGTDVSQFRNASAFASWLGLCPEKKISGGKVLYTKSRRVRSRVATALRMGAHHCITPKTIWVSSFDVSRASSANLKPRPPRLTNWRALSITFSGPRSHTTRACSIAPKPIV